MKKSVILTILVIYIAAIVTVGFIGIALKIRSGDVKYVEQIKVSDSFKDTYNYSSEPVVVNGEVIADGSIEWKYDKEKENVIIIKCQAVPSDAANTTLKYVLDLDQGFDEANPPEDITGKTFSFLVQKDGTLRITLLKDKDVTVTVKSSDRNPGASLRIRIKIKIGGGGIVPPKK